MYKLIVTISLFTMLFACGVKSRPTVPVKKDKAVTRIDKVTNVNKNTNEAQQENK